MKNFRTILSILLLLFIPMQACAMRKRIVFKSTPDTYDLYYFENIAVDDGGCCKWRGIDLLSGKVLWKAEGTCSSDNPIDQNGNLYLATNGEKLLRVNVRTGQTEEVATPGVLTSNVYCTREDFLMARTSNNMTMAYSLLGHRVLWTSDVEFRRLIPYDNFFLGTYIPHRGRVPLPQFAYGPEIVIVDKETGAMRPLSIGLDRKNLSYSDIIPVLDAGVILVDINDAGTGKLECLDAWDLKVRWTIEANTDDVRIVKDTMVLLEPGDIRGVDPITGDTKWKVEFHSLDPAGDTTVKWTNDIAVWQDQIETIAGIEQSFYCIGTRTGTVLEKFPVGIATSPYFYQGRYYWYDLEKHRILTRKARATAHK